MAQALALPHLTNTGVTLALGAMAAQYILRRKAVAYVPARSVVPSLDSGALYLVPDAPRFPYPVWVVWREDVDEQLRDAAHTALVRTVSLAETAQQDVIEQLAEISDDPVEVLGEAANILHED